MLFLDVKRRNQITCTSGNSAAYKWNCENGVRACMWARVRVCVRANAEQKRAKGDLMVMWNEKCQSNRRSQKWKEAQQQTTAAALQATLWRRQTELTNTWMLNNLYAGKKKRKQSSFVIQNAAHLVRNAKMKEYYCAHTYNKHINLPTTR